MMYYNDNEFICNDKQSYITFDDLEQEEKEYETYISEIPEVHRLKSFYNGNIPEKDLDETELEMISFMPKLKNDVSAYEQILQMESCSAMLDNPSFLYRKLGIIIHKRFNKVNFLYPKKEQIQDLYKIVDLLDNRFFVGFIDDELLSCQEIDAECDFVELKFFLDVDVVYIRTSFLKFNGLELIQKTKKCIAQAILSYRRINFYHRKIFFEKLDYCFPEFVQHHCSVQQNQKRKITTISEEVEHSKKVQKAKEPEPKKIKKLEKEVVLQQHEFKKYKSDWCFSKCGLHYTYAWKLIFIRNSPVCLSEKGQRFASFLRFGKNSKNIINEVTNGKSMESDLARTMEHFLHLIQKIGKEKYDDEYILIWILKCYTTFKLFRAFELQVRFSDCEDEPDIQLMENSRKCKRFFLNSSTVDEFKTNRPIKDIDEVLEQLSELKTILKIENKNDKIVPSQKTLQDYLYKKIDEINNESIFEVCNYDWESVISNNEHQKTFDDLKNISKILALYTTIIRKSPSFFLYVETETAQIPYLLCSNVKNSSEEAKKKSLVLLNELFSLNT